MVLLVLAILALTLYCDPPEEKPPNILLIMVDDLGKSLLELPG
jgi:hypothetical protein